MKIELSNGVSLNYEVNGSGPDMILIHGNGSSHQDFSKLVPKLAQHFKVYAVDSRGQGASSHAGQYATYQDMAEDYQLFIQELNLSDVTIVGHSDGAIIGTLLGLMKIPQLRQLILISLTINTTDTTDEVKALMKEMIQAEPDNPLTQLMQNEPNIPLEDLTNIEVPSLVIAADQDVMTVDKYLAIAETIPTSQLYIVPGANHINMVIDSDRLYPEILRFGQSTADDIDKQNQGGAFGKFL